jgi:beta-glucosidase/6-phospho-beta-glucosidase/beta-galactosidase
LVWFDTAWSPPDGIYEEMYAAGIQVEAAYCEQGVGYMGWWKDGEECVVDMPVENDFNEDSMDFYHEIDKFFEDAGIAHAPEGLGG